MKTKVLLTLFLIIPVVGFILMKSNSETAVSLPPFPNNNISDSFLIGVLEDGRDVNFQYIDGELGLNLWHWYTQYGENIGGRHLPLGWTDLVANDKLLTAHDDYVPQIEQVLHNIGDVHNMKTLMDRPKIEWLCYGQRSDYQCEDVPLSNELWFYAFNSNDPTHVHSGHTTQDGSSWGNGVTVKFCRTVNSTNQGNWVDNAGWVVDRLRANTEQCNRNSSTEQITFRQWTTDSECDWLLKPRIRIPQSFVTTEHDETPVCSLKVIAEDGQTVLKNVIIKAKYFRDAQIPHNYNGSYKEEFWYDNDPVNLTIEHRDWATTGGWEAWAYHARGDHNPDHYDDNHADIQVYWYGNCDMWLDYVRVDNDVASDLLSNNPLNPNWVRYNNWLQWEAELACYNQSPLKFYIELFEYNNIPCISYVSRKLSLYCGRQVNMMADQLAFYQFHMPGDHRGEIVTADKIKRYYIDSVGATQVFGGHYPFTAAWQPPCGAYQKYSKIPNTLPNTSGDEILATTDGPASYDSWLQENLDNPANYYEGTSNSNGACCPDQAPGLYRVSMKTCNGISRLADIPFIAWVQSHQMRTNGDMQREPTAEEMDLIVNLPVSYGAKGIIYWQYPSWYSSPCDYGYCFLDPHNNNNTPRYTNVYGQPKWEKFKAIFRRLKRWQSTVMSFDNTQSFSYIYQFAGERNDLINSTYFTEVQSFAPDPLDFDNPAPTPDVPDQRFLQAAVFRNSSETRNRYFMLVNKRCSPYYAPGEDPRFPNGQNGGRRYMSVKFDENSNDFANFNNWKIVNVENNSTVLTFDKRISTSLGLGWFKPGEGRLYKIAPVMAEGGTLVTDENVAGITFDCSGAVYNGGKNITIGLGTTINFKDNAKIVMSQGNFTAGNYSNPDGPRNIRFRCSNALWDGMQFNNCGTVNISNSVFENIKPSTPVDSVNYAVKLIDCFVYNISNNTFTNYQGYSSGAINSVFVFDSNPPVINPYIGRNTFDMNTSSRMVVKVQSFASHMVPVLISWNTFSHGPSGTASAIFLSNINGCAVKNNTITNYLIGVNTFAAGVDLYKNTITSSLSGAKGLSGAAYSVFNMAVNGDVVTAGYNIISNDGSNSYNVDVKNSYFLTDNGQGIFNISVQNQCKHLNGHFPNDGTPIDINARYNCFKDNGNPVQPPVYNVTWGEGGPLVDFVFDPYMPDCVPSGPEGSIVLNLGNGVYDTLGTLSGGGGESSAIIITPKTIYDSICVEMRKRNYGTAKNKCIELLTLFADSLQSLDAVFKLYLSSKMTDTSTSSYSALKVFYETLILNHSGNVSLVKRCNYLVQKCKVLLRQYSSAMSGFEQIINQNPYSYEGLIARWDYMATHLLDSLSGGAVRGEGDEDDDSDTLRTGLRQFTKEERKLIKQTIIEASETSRNFEEKKIEILKERVKDGDVTALKELKEKMTLKDVIKTDHPHNMFEHIKIVNSDIRKVFGQQGTDNNAGQNSLPVEFSLSQNYPNPFNPVTKIKYGLPRDLKVTIKIYDIIGREVKTLVNEFKKAGYYEENFDGSNLATGVYFYRLEAGEFVQSKKMVLVK